MATDSVEPLRAAADQPLAAIGVVVPAYNEADLIGACLASVRAAAEQVDLPVHVVVVDDGSDDATALLAASALAGISARVIPGSGRNVGAARAAGVEAVISHFDRVPAAALWLAMTDADSVVPRDWLAYQVLRANAGADAIAGLIDIAAAPGLHRLFEPGYRRAISAASHAHVHGANLAMRASTYLRAGGFAPLGCSEDVELWTRVRELCGLAAIADPRLVVRTSARLVSRVEGGFASDLRGIVSAAS